MRATQPLQRPGSITLVCTDGSSRTTAELRRGLRVASNAQRTVVATVVRPAWPVDQIAGVDVTTGEPQLTLPADQRREDARRRADALTMLEKTCTRLNLDDAEMVVLHLAEPARALRKLAASLPASVIILGGGERSRVTRALCGSVTVTSSAMRHVPSSSGTRRDSPRTVGALARPHALDSSWTQRFASWGHR